MISIRPKKDKGSTKKKELCAGFDSLRIEIIVFFSRSIVFFLCFDLSRSVSIETQNFFHNTRQNSVFTAVCTNRSEPFRIVPIGFDWLRFVSILTFSFRSYQIETNLRKNFYFNGINTKNPYFCPLWCVIAMFKAGVCLKTISGCLDCVYRAALVFEHAIQN